MLTLTLVFEIIVVATLSADGLYLETETPFGDFDGRDQKLSYISFDSNDGTPSNADKQNKGWRKKLYFVAALLSESSQSGRCWDPFTRPHVLLSMYYHCCAPSLDKGRNKTLLRSSPGCVTNTVSMALIQLCLHVAALHPLPVAALLAGVNDNDEDCGYASLVDWWSLGVVLYECLVGFALFARQRHCIGDAKRRREGKCVQSG